MNPTRPRCPLCASPLRLTALLLLLALWSSCSTPLQSKRSRTKQESTEREKSDYDKIVREGTKIAQGLFGIYTKEGDYYFEIPQRLLGRDMLVVNRILQVPEQLNDAGINKGISYEDILIALELNEKKDHLLIRNIKPKPHYPQEDFIGQSVRDNFVSPLMGRLKVEGFGPDSATLLVNVTELYDGRSTLLNNMYDHISIGGSIDRELSSIVRAKAFENNVTVVSDLSTKVSEGRSTAYLTVRSSSSIVLLPKTPMPGRYLSSRVGYFTVPVTYYADDQTAVERKELITRWRLEPKDPAAYLRGELVEPVKPIVFYIDPSTPKKWRKYMKEGIEEWRTAFERAGFKNAITAREVDEEMDHDDLSYSGINYIASEKANAMGPSVYDPRSGEIIQADIIWWHNVLTMLRNWLILQTGAVNPEAAHWQLPDHLLGDAMRFVAAHEVGHSLGLRHNMIASSAYTVAQLRDPAFTKEYGVSPSIMDYARYNYVAQPGDGVIPSAPKVGPYDLLAIEYGYRWYGGQGPKADQPKLQALLDRHKGPLYRYSEAQEPRDEVDPRTQVEDLSDDPTEAATLGIANLKRLLPRLLEITADGNPHQGYDEAGMLYSALINQWNTLLFHPMAVIGGIYLEQTDRSQPDAESYRFVPKKKQQQALDFLIREGIKETKWLFEAPLAKHTFPIRTSPMGLVENAPSLLLKNAQSYLFWDLLDNRRLIRMSLNEWHNGKEAFTSSELIDTLYKELFGKTERGEELTVEEKFVQQGLLDALLLSVSNDRVVKKNALTTEPTAAQEQTRELGVYRMINFNGSLADRISDAISIKRALMIRIRKAIEPRRHSGSTAMRGHYTDMALRIDHALGFAPNK